MTARAEWIPSKLELTNGIEFVLGKRSVMILATADNVRSGVELEPKTPAEAAELSIALKRAQRRMDQIFRDMRAAEDASR